MTALGRFASRVVCRARNSLAFRAFGVGWGSVRPLSGVAASSRFAGGPLSRGQRLSVHFVSRSISRTLRVRRHCSVTHTQSEGAPPPPPGSPCPGSRLAGGHTPQPAPATGRHPHPHAGRGIGHSHTYRTVHTCHVTREIPEKTAVVHVLRLRDAYLCVCSASVAPSGFTLQLHMSHMPLSCPLHVFWLRVGRGGRCVRREGRADGRDEAIRSPPSYPPPSPWALGSPLRSLGPRPG